METKAREVPEKKRSLRSMRALLDVENAAERSSESVES
jgi:hypothetical protein